MRILVTGASGLLGSHLVASLSRRHELVGVDRHPWWGDQPAQVVLGDLTVPGFISQVVDQSAPETLIHCAALVNVDACEQNPGLAYAYNAEVTRRLLESIPPGCLFVYLSTDGIFKGDRPHATEDYLPSPRTTYGRSKLQGEWEVQLATENHLIVRTNFYGWSSGRKQTAAEWLYHSLREGKPITLFSDFFFTPIYVVDFVERLEALLDGSFRGIVHLSGGERVSKSRFGELLAQEAGFQLEHVREGSVSDAPLIAYRPKDMSLDSSRFCRLTGSDLPDCLTGIRRFLKDRRLPLSERFTSSAKWTANLPS